MSTRVMTYNVHGCVGLDGKRDEARIASVIAASGADVVALQELDVSRKRSAGVDQARILAEKLEMEHIFFPAWKISADEQYGDAILSRLPMRVHEAASLPTVESKKELEPRGALWVGVENDGIKFQIINTHLGLRYAERLAQVDELLGEDWLKAALKEGPCILCGDFNSIPPSEVYRRLASHLKDSQRDLAGWKPRSTFPSRFPMLRLDYIFTSDDLKVVNSNIPLEKEVRMASDHLPLIVDLEYDIKAVLDHKGVGECPLPLHL